jgi:hypothetical protein
MGWPMKTEPGSEWMKKTSSWSLVSLNPIGELLQILLHTLCLYLIGELPFSDDLTGKMQKCPDASGFWEGGAAVISVFQKRGGTPCAATKSFPYFFPYWLNI